MVHAPSLRRNYLIVGVCAAPHTRSVNNDDDVVDVLHPNSWPKVTGYL
jgi:hypothetical protein